MIRKLFYFILLTAVIGFTTCTDKRINNDDLPTLYEYYTKGGITAGLETLPDTFQLNKKNITIFSGAIHYFRVHPEHWRDRLRKLRAAGFNAVETYVPWNLHEPEQDVYDFGDGDRDMSAFLDVAKYIKTAQEEDLLVLVRPSPYICAEWELGGMPSWLLRYPGLIVRSSEQQFVDRVTKYNSKLLPILESLQFTKGGPIIGLQIENEYGALAENGNVDLDYLLFLKQDYESHGIVELLYTADNPSIHTDTGAIPGVLQTGNFNTNPEHELSVMKQLQPDKPSMVMEYWSGWYDVWFQSHHTSLVSVFSDILERILKYPASVNLYMFHGGTSFGFMNGANAQNYFPHYTPEINSYDYDAPLTEAGDYTQKYNVCKEIVAKYNKVATKIPDQPSVAARVQYDPVPVSGQFDFNEIIDKIEPDDHTKSDHVMSMEMLPVNNGSGQSYGFVLYRQVDAPTRNNSVLQISGDAIYDLGIVMMGGIRQTEILNSSDQLHNFGYWETKDANLSISSMGSVPQTLDILVENWGRLNYGVRSTFNDTKGLREGTRVLLDNAELTDWEIVSLQFKSKWVKSLDGWNPVNSEMKSPTLFHAEFEVDSPSDTFLNMTDWGKGVVFINGFNLGRYFSAGPVHSLYVPGPLINNGTNHIVVFELFTPGTHIQFSADPILG